MHDLQAEASLRDASCLFLGLLQAEASLRDGLLLRRHLATDVAQNGVQAEPCLGNAGDRDLRRHQDGVLIGVAGHLALHRHRHIHIYAAPDEEPFDLEDRCRRSVAAWLSLLPVGVLGTLVDLRWLLEEPYVVARAVV